jgi:two-component system sensor histidine kinase/response regulator
MISNNIAQSLLPAILLVDDNPQNLQVLGKILLENNYRIEFSTSGVAALEWLKTKRFDLILLDINMPEMDGFEVCRRIRSNPLMNNIPVIFLSADADRESILRGFELGAQDYVTKPFDSRELLVRVRTHLKLKDSLEKLEKFNRLLEEKVIERTRELKESYEKLEASNIKLLDLDKAKSGFLKLISHEIRTPLNGILGPMELLRSAGYPTEIVELVEMVDTSVRRLEKFSLNALLITRLKTKHGEFKKEKINLSELIGEVLLDEEKQIQAGNIQIDRTDETIIDLFQGDAELTKKCIGNILGNSVRFTPASSTVGISTYRENQYVICEIKDHGKGFVLEDTDRVFELFTTDNEYKDNCIGIGLPIARMIMDELGGSIKIGNNPEGGAFVKLSFRNNQIVEY